MSPSDSLRIRPRAALLGGLLVLTGIAGMSVSPGASAYGYGHGRHGYGVGIHYRHYGGGHRYRHRGHGRHHGGGVSFSYYGPLYLPRIWSPPPPPAPVSTLTRRRAPRALPSMPDLAYTPQAGQDEELQTRDRRQCERQAWRQTRPDPTRGYVRTTRTTHVSNDYRRYPSDPIGPAASGAALGALGGAIAGDAGAGAAIGAAVGAASWLLGGGSTPRPSTYEVVVQEYVPPPGPESNVLRDAVVECMEARGYGVSLPSSIPREGESG